eukprot:GHVR01066428.1.p1 GENE.GHVR01066428.1~~GHVR01066428.1.p1  ORF type:complete len:263 (+),score=40.18 GHVR01066428.1:49-837(+)
MRDSLVRQECDLPSPERVLKTSNFYTKGPAPNEYTLPIDMCHSSLKYKNSNKWSFGLARQYPPPRTDLTGPGAYTPAPVIKREPHWGFGTDSRHWKYRKESIGNTHEMPESAIFKHRRSPNYKFPSKPRDSLEDWFTAKNFVPGPGKYDTNTTLHIPSTRGQGGWTFGAICSSSSPRVGIHSDRPGPQTHSTYSELTTRRAPVCRFGSAVRHVSAPLMLKSSRTPGPGTYADQSEDSRKIAPSAPNYSMKSRRPLSFAKTFV